MATFCPKMGSYSATFIVFLASLAIKLENLRTVINISQTAP